VKFLLDTNIVSEIRRPTPDQGVMAWIEEHDTQSCYISAITVLEIELGTIRLERRDPAQGRTLRHWVETRFYQAFEDRILPIDGEIARRAAAFHVPDPKPDRDALIAASAVVHDMPLITRNTRDFMEILLGQNALRLINPFHADK
jgi:toxin FitB